LPKPRQFLARGRYPGSLKQNHGAAANDNFRALADEWLAKRTKEGLAPQTITKFEWFIRLVEDDVGKLAVRDIGTPEVLRALRRVEARERFHSARRLRSTLSRIFRYGIAAGRAERDPAADLSEALTAAPVKARPAITTAEGLAGILRAISDYQGAKEVRIGLLLLIHIFCRPGELRHMEWAEIDLHKSLWSIPASKMKMRQSHSVPLSDASLGLLEELRRSTAAGMFCFPSIRSPSRPMSENTLNAALRRLGYTRDEVCSHGSFLHADLGTRLRAD
jgi:integrase